MESATSKYLVLTREFDAPPELVWRCWTEPEHFRAWFSPHPLDMPYARLDLRVGGQWRAAMRWLEGELKGTEIHFGGEYTEVEPYRRLVMTDHFMDSEGNVVPGSHYDMGGFPEEGVDIIVELEPHSGGTRMTVTQTLPLELARKFGAEQGWGQCLEKLAAHLQEMQA